MLPCCWEIRGSGCGAANRSPQCTESSLTFLLRRVLMHVQGPGYGDAENTASTATLRSRRRWKDLTSRAAGTVVLTFLGGLLLRLKGANGYRGYRGIGPFTRRAEQSGA